MPEPSKIKEYLTFAEQLAQDAGAIIQAALDKRELGDATNVAVKSNNASDIVTETDQAVEKFIKARLDATFPGHKFIGEESAKDTVFTDEPTWIVDPIDGTNNFVHGFPCVAVCIGLTIGKEPVVGVVYNPMTRELFSAGQGLGARLGDRTLPLQRAPLDDLSQCIVATEIGSDRSAQAVDKKIAFLHALVRHRDDGGKQARSMRATGSAALNMCNVAKGCVDVYWEVGCWEWDVCAAMVIVREAGGIVVSGSPRNPSDAPCNIFSRKYMAIRPAQSKNAQLQIAREMWSILPDIDAPRKDVPGGFVAADA